MSSNASTQSGASSLMSALNQHDLSNLSEESIVQLIKNADEDDGVKILNHIYGGSSNAKKEQESLAKQSGLSTGQMATIMAVAAPALLTLVSAAKKKQQAQAQAEAQAKAQAEAEAAAAAAAAQKQNESEQLMALLQSLSGINTGNLTTSTTTSGKKTTSSTTTGKKTGSGKKTSSAKTNSTTVKPTQTQAQQSSGMDLGDIMNMASLLTGGTSSSKPQQTQQSSGMDLGSLMGLAGTLMGGSTSGKKTNSTDGLSSLLGTLLQGKKLF
jgi:mannose/fructose-specific phosphotransferase system component IIA